MSPLSITCVASACGLLILFACSVRKSYRQARLARSEQRCSTLQSDLKRCAETNFYSSFQKSLFAQIPLSVDRSAAAMASMLRERCDTTAVPLVLIVRPKERSLHCVTAESPALRQLAMELTPLVLARLRAIAGERRRGASLLGKVDMNIQRLEAFGGTAVFARGWGGEENLELLLLALLRTAQDAKSVQDALAQQYLDQIFELHLGMCLKAEEGIQELAAREERTLGLVHDANAATERALALLLASECSAGGASRMMLLEELFSSSELHNEVLQLGYFRKESVQVPISDFLPTLIKRLALFCQSVGVELRLSGEIHSRNLAPAMAVQRILSNYVMNSLRHANSGRLELEIRCSDAEVKFRVKDAGSALSGVSQIGLDDFKAPSDTTRHRGLGLQSCSALARMHGGYAWFEPSRSSQTSSSSGATFGAAFPVQAAATATTATAIESRLLLIEDDTALLRRYLRDLSSLVTTIDTATSLSEARVKLSKGQFDCVLADFRLRDGLLSELVELRELSFPVVVCSGGMTRGQREEMQKIAEVYFLEKPIMRQELRSVLQRVQEGVLWKERQSSSGKAAAVV